MIYSRQQVEPGVRVTEAVAAGECFIRSWRIVFYPPGYQQDVHEHQEDQLSALITGRMLEIHGSERYEPQPMTAEFKPAGYRHANTYGSDGALLLSLNLDCTHRTMLEARPGREWCATASSEISVVLKRLARSLLGASLDQDQGACMAIDLLTMLTAGEDQIDRVKPPRWLLRARDALIETEDSVAKIARDAGVHRVHLSRMFHRYFRETVSGFRRHARLARAMRLCLVEGQTPAGAAAAAGFCDQSHYTRTHRHAVGVTPAKLQTHLRP